MQFPVPAGVTPGSTIQVDVGKPETDVAPEEAKREASDTAAEVRVCVKAKYIMMHLQRMRGACTDACTHTLPQILLPGTGVIDADTSS